MTSTGATGRPPTPAPTPTYLPPGRASASMSQDSADEAARSPADAPAGEPGGERDGASSGFGPAQLRAVAAAVGVTLLALAVSLVGGVAAVVPVLLFELDVASPPAFLGLTVAGQLGFLVAGYAVARRWDLAVPFSLPDGREFGIGVGGALLAVGSSPSSRWW